MHAEVGDRHGNLVFNESRPQLQPAVRRGRAADPRRPSSGSSSPGELDPDHIHTPGIFVQRVVLVGPDDTVAEKRIERRTVRPRATEES